MHITKKRIQEIIREELQQEITNEGVWDSIKKGAKIAYNAPARLARRTADKIYDATQGKLQDLPRAGVGPADKAKEMMTPGAEKDQYEETTQDYKDASDAASSIASIATFGLGGAAIQGGKALAQMGLKQGLKKAGQTAATNIATGLPSIAKNVGVAKSGDMLNTFGKSVATSAAGAYGTIVDAASSAFSKKDPVSKKPVKPAAPARPATPTKTPSATRPTQSTQPLNYTPAEQTQTKITNEGERHMKMTNSQLAQIIREEIGNVIKEVGQLSGQSQAQAQLRAPNTPNEDSKNANEMTEEENLEETAYYSRDDDDPLNESQFVDIIRKEIASLFSKAK